MSKRISNYKASAAEFGKRLTALYKLKFFPRLGKEFADELFKSGVEAGAKISALSNISDAGNKIRVATDALVTLNQVAFAAQVMVEGGFYTAEQTAPVNAYIEKLIDALSGLISSVKVRQTGGDGRRMQHRIVVEQKPVVKRRVIVNAPQDDNTEATYTNGQQTSMTLDIPTVTSDMDDGFNAPYNK